jgi:hypothetical protein
MPHNATSTDNIVDMPGRDSDLEYGLARGSITARRFSRVLQNISARTETARVLPALEPILAVNAFLGPITVKEKR